MCKSRGQYVKAGTEWSVTEVMGRFDIDFGTELNINSHPAQIKVLAISYNQ